MQSPGRTWRLHRPGIQITNDHEHTHTHPIQNDISIFRNSMKWRCARAHSVLCVCVFQAKLWLPVPTLCTNISLNERYIINKSNVICRCCMLTMGIQCVCVRVCINKQYVFVYTTNMGIEHRVRDKLCIYNTYFAYTLETLTYLSSSTQSWYDLLVAASQRLHRTVYDEKNGNENTYIRQPSHHSSFMVMMTLITNLPSFFNALTRFSIHNNYYAVSHRVVDVQLMEKKGTCRANERGGCWMESSSN